VAHNVIAVKHTPSQNFLTQTLIFLKISFRFVKFISRYDFVNSRTDKGNMAKVPKNAKQGEPRNEAIQPSTAHLDKLIADATVDCYNEAEEITGIFTMLEENLVVPFTTALLGVEVTVERVDLNDADEIVAVCRRGRESLRVPVIDLPLPKPKPRGTEWIDAYRRWVQGR